MYRSCHCGDHCWQDIGRGFVALLSPDDAHLFARKWHAGVDHKGYVRVRRNLPKPDGKRTTVSLSQAVICPSAGKSVDHVDGNTLDNRRSNLREATTAQNNANCKLYRSNRVGLKGVYPVAEGKFRGRIKHGPKVISLGVFETAEEAHAAYCGAAKIIHGDFARAK